MTIELTGCAKQLGDLMSHISEEIYGAGWLHDIEWVLWKALLRWRHVGRAGWTTDSEFSEDLALYMWELDWLQRQASGWVWWLNGEKFVPEERWLRLVEARNVLLHSNTQLNHAVAR